MADFFERGIDVGEDALEDRMRDNEPFARSFARYPPEFLLQMLVTARTAHQPSDPQGAGLCARFLHRFL
ncbi:MAG: hypothetical protein EON61_01720 [Alphaproteobacteria bacterium]|nr:MAG: hypothetical protein EON61_01720 [Alphaproteobacteria bacterium]